MRIKVKIYNGMAATLHLRDRLDKLEAFFRYHLCRLLQVYYLNRISSKDVYLATGARSMLVDTIRVRQSLMAHMLREHSLAN